MTSDAQHGRHGTAFLVAGIVLAAGVAAWLVAGLLAPGVPPGDDGVPHLLRLRFLLRELAPAWRPDGWQPDVGLGYRVFLFYGPGYYWAAAGLHGASLGALPEAGAIELLAALSLVALPLAAAFLARSFALDRTAAGLAAVLSLGVASSTGGAGLEGTFGIGLYPHAFAAPFALVNLGAAMRLVRTPRRRWLALTAVTLAVVMVSHPISAIVLALLWTLVLPTLLWTQPVTLRAAAHLALAVLLAAALAGFWLLPAVAHRDLRGILTGWPMQALGERVADLLLGRSFLPGIAMVGLAAAGWGYAVLRTRARRPWALALVLAPPLYLLLAEALRLWDPHHVLTMQLAHRGLGTLGVLTMLPAAALLSWLADLGGNAGRGVALALAAGTVLAVTTPQRALVRSDLPGAGIERLAAAIVRFVPPGARFATQAHPRQWEITGVRRPAFWLAYASGRPTLNFYNAESSPVRGEVVFAADAMTREPPDRIADLLSRLGVSHVALVQSGDADGLLSSPRFHAVWHEPPLALLAVMPRDGQPGPEALLTAEAPLAARLVEATPERLVLEADATRDTAATVAVAWSPAWRLTVDGAPAPTWRSRDGLVSLRLPRGRSALALVYERDGWDTAGPLLSLCGMLGLLGLLVTPIPGLPSERAG